MNQNLHYFIEKMVFEEQEADEQMLANYIAIIGEKNGLSCNDIRHIFPLILRMLKSQSNWSD